MREIPCRDGSVALYDQDDDQDMVIVEPTVTSFAPVRGNARCVCGAAGSVELALCGDRRGRARLRALPPRPRAH